MSETSSPSSSYETAYRQSYSPTKPASPSPAHPEASGRGHALHRRPRTDDARATAWPPDARADPTARDRGGHCANSAPPLRRLVGSCISPELPDPAQTACDAGIRSGRRQHALRPHVLRRGWRSPSSHTTRLDESRAQGFMMPPIARPRPALEAASEGPAYGSREGALLDRSTRGSSENPLNAEMLSPALTGGTGHEEFPHDREPSLRPPLRRLATPTTSSRAGSRRDRPRATSVAHSAQNDAGAG